MDHCSKFHFAGIPHHYFPPKVARSLWAWELDVRYVVQLLLEEALFLLGLNQALFVMLVKKGDATGVLGQVCALIGAACALPMASVNFYQKLIGHKYKGLYLPGQIDKNTVLCRDELWGMGKVAVEMVVSKAREWIGQRLLPEMAAFDYTTLATSSANLPDKRFFHEDSKKEKDGVKVLGKKVTVEIGEDSREGYLWNAFGLFFRRGVVYGTAFPPATVSMGYHDELSFSVWHAFEAAYAKKYHESVGECVEETVVGNQKTMELERVVQPELGRGHRKRKATYRVRKEPRDGSVVIGDVVVEPLPKEEIANLDVSLDEICDVVSNM